MAKSANNAKSTRAATARKSAGATYRGKVATTGKTKYYGATAKTASKKPLAKAES